MDVSNGWFQTEISVGMTTLFVTKTETVRTMPKQPSPPTVNLGGTSVTTLSPS